MTTITASSTLGISLSTPSYANPIVINPGVTISSGGNAVYAPSGYWTIQNDGLIAGNPATPTATPNVAGIKLLLGGDITNQSTATITGYHGIYADYGHGLKTTNVLNFGNIGGNPTFGDGVYLGTGGSVTNKSGGSINGYHGISGQELTVVNYGSIAGNLLTPNIGAGVDLHAGGAVTNQSDSFISGRFGVISDTNGAVATVVNAGYIGGSLAGSPNRGVGVLLGVGGLVTNQIGGTISGYSGIEAGYNGTATVVNAGTISGITNSVGFTTGHVNRLVADPGAVFKGTVNGGNAIGAAVISTLELASGASSGTLSGLGTQFINFVQTTVGIGATWTLTGTNSVGSGATIANYGSLKLFGASLTDYGVLTGPGITNIDPSTLIVNNVSGGGTIQVGSSSTLTVQGTVSAGETITFTGTNGVVNILHAGSFAGTITGQGPTDQVNIACFPASTRLLAMSGEVQVEDLRVGDEVVTLARPSPCADRLAGTAARRLLP